MSYINEEFIREILNDVSDTIYGKSINHVVKNISILSGAEVAFSIECEKKDFVTYSEIAEKCKQALDSRGVKAKVSLTNKSHISASSKKRAVPNVGRIIIVASGKGGVGKSTVAFNLAISLAKQGKRVGVVDADIYGPSLPKLSAISKKPALDDENMMIPHHKFGIKMMSVGYLVDAEDALIWRGPMTTKVLNQLIMTTNWAYDGEPLDYLVIDTPPGTGDVHLSLAENFEIDGAIIVSTPQDLSVADASKSVSMYQKLSIPIVGFIKNYAFFESDNGDKSYVFGDGNALEKLAKKVSAKSVVEIPVLQDVSSASDSGRPLSYYDDAHKFTKIFLDYSAYIIKAMEH